VQGILVLSFILEIQSYFLGELMTAIRTAYEVMEVLG
jgi:hypothetical protein